MTHPRQNRLLQRCCKTAVVLLTFLSVLNAPAALLADTTEIRDYVITVDGKQAGSTTVQITKKDNGITDVSVRAAVRVKILITFTFNLTGTEWWKDGKLYYLNASVDENGTKTKVSAVPEGGRLKVRVNGRDSFAPADAWTTSFWRLPDQKYHNKKITILESDSGKTEVCMLRYIGTEQISVSGQSQPCYHFRVLGSSPCDLWFDKYYRLVRREFVERNHRTAIHLTSVRR